VNIGITVLSRALTLAQNARSHHCPRNRAAGSSDRMARDNSRVAQALLIIAREHSGCSARCERTLSRCLAWCFLARYKQDPRFSVLLPRRHGRKRGSHALLEGQERMISLQIQEVAGTGENPSLAALHRKIAACRKRRLPIPSYGTVLRRLYCNRKHHISQGRRSQSHGSFSHLLVEDN
jgi:hypothetical protein